MLPVPIDAPLRYRRGVGIADATLTYIAWMCPGQLIPFDHAAWGWRTTATVSSGSGRIAQSGLTSAARIRRSWSTTERAGIGNQKSGSCRFRCIFRVAGRGPTAVATAGKPGAACDRRRRWLAGAALERRWSADVSYVFAALGAALAAFGLITAGAVATGAWFGPLVRPRPRVLARDE